MNITKRSSGHVCLEHKQGDNNTGVFSLKSDGKLYPHYILGKKPLDFRPQKS